MRTRIALLGVVAAAALIAAPLAQAATVSLEDDGTGQQQCYITADRSSWNSSGHGDRVRAALVSDFPQAAQQFNELANATKESPTQPIPAESQAAIDKATASAGFDSGEAETMLRAAMYAGMTGFYDKPLSITNADLMNLDAKKQSAASIAAEYVHTQAALAYFEGLLEADGIDYFAADFNAAVEDCADLLGAGESSTAVSTPSSTATPTASSEPATSPASSPAPVPAAPAPSSTQAAPVTAAPKVENTVSAAQQIGWLAAALIVAILATLGVTTLATKR